MRESDKKKFLEIMTSMAEIYGKVLSKTSLVLYFKLLKQFPLDDIERAALQILERRKYSTFPLPADFIDAISPHQDQESAAILATEEVLEKMRVKGADTSPSFEDDVIHRAITLMGGWVRACEEFNLYPPEKQAIWKSYFRKLFTASLETSGRPRLIGRHEQQNIFSGHFNPKTGLLRLANGETQPANFIEDPEKQLAQREEPKQLKKKNE